MRPTPVKLLEENMGRKLHSIGPGSDFLVVTPKAQEQKKKIDKLDCMKFKNIFSVRQYYQ